MARGMSDKPTCYGPPASEIPMSYTFIPDVVKSRLPALTSLHRTVKTTITRCSTASYSHRPSQGSRHDCMAPDDAPVGSDGEIVPREQLWQVSGRTKDAGPKKKTSTISPSAIPPQAAAAPPDLILAAPIHETRTGVEWDTAVTALLLLTKACARAHNPEAKPENTRALIVDANKWLLRSLPNPLCPRELEAIEEVLPMGLDDPARISRHQARDRDQSATGRPDKRSWLRRVIAFFILQISLFVAVIIPYVATLAQRCYRIERRHHLTERLLTGGIDITSVVGESGMELKDAMVRFGQGRFGDAVVHMGGWILDSVVGGVSDGVGKGLAIVGEAILARER